VFVNKEVILRKRRDGELLSGISRFCWGLLAFVGSCGRFPSFDGFSAEVCGNCWQLWAIFGVCGRFVALMPAASVFVPVSSGNYYLVLDAKRGVKAHKKCG
jgi:hypothetical protein